MGVIQMINKQEPGQKEIPEEDVEELQQICPSIAEVLNFCDLAKDVTDVSAGLTLHMDQVIESV